MMRRSDICTVRPSARLELQRFCCSNLRLGCKGQCWVIRRNSTVTDKTLKVNSKSRLLLHICTTDASPWKEGFRCLTLTSSMVSKCTLALLCHALFMSPKAKSSLTIVPQFMLNLHLSKHNSVCTGRMNCHFLFIYFLLLFWDWVTVAAG